MEKKDEENGKGDEKQDEAKLKLVNAVVNPSDEQLSSLSVLPRVMPVPLAIGMTYEEALNPARTESLFTIFARHYLKLNRSVNARVLERTVTLALEQIGAEAEEEEIEGDDSDNR